MKVVFRGGPKDRQRAVVQDGIYGLELSKPNIGAMTHYDLNTGAIYPTDALIRGRYSRTMDQTKKGVYYMVWMGWDE